MEGLQWLILLFASFLTVSVNSSENPRPRRSLTRLSFAKLQELDDQTKNNLRRALQLDGALLLTDIPGHDAAVTSALGAFGDCIVQEPPSRSSQGPIHRRLGGGTQRWTLGTSTHNGVVQPLPEWAGAACPLLEKSAAPLRSITSLLLTVLGRAIDLSVPVAASQVRREHQDSANRKWGLLSKRDLQKPLHEPTPVEVLVRKGLQLEHFHQYYWPENSSSDQLPALTPHTDAGLLQALAVRWSENVNERSNAGPHGLEVFLPDGEVLAPELVTNTIGSGSAGEGAGLLVLVGQGASEWLPHLGLRAAPHALSSKNRNSHAQRLVYGVMALPPEDWPLVTSGHGNVTFGEWWRMASKTVSHNSEENAKLHHVDDAGPGCLSSGTLQRHLQDLALSCPAGQIYCWMQCMAVPAGLPCGTDQAVCMSSTTHQVCPESGTHDAACKPQCPATNDLVLTVQGAGETGGLVNGIYKADGWNAGKRVYLQDQRTDPRPQGRARIQWDPIHRQWELFVMGYKSDTILYLSQTDSSTPPSQGWEVQGGIAPAPTIKYKDDGGGAGYVGQGFCNGILTDMHMLGFAWSGEEHPCLIFLFNSWQLTDAGKFWAAFFGTIGAGVLAEYLVAARRWESTTPLRCLPQRKCFHYLYKLVLYACTRTMGYFVMLISMTYSVEMFLAVIIGLTVGHAIFNINTAPGEDTTPCCQADGRVSCTSSSSLCCTRDVDSHGAVEHITNGNSVVGKGNISSLEESQPQVCTSTLQVEGMTCDGCVRTVRRAVESLEGVRTILELSLAKGTVIVELHGRPSLQDHALKAERVRQVIEGVGFVATVLSPSCAGTIHASTPKGKRTGSSADSTGGSFAAVQAVVFN